MRGRWRGRRLFLVVGRFARSLLWHLLSLQSTRGNWGRGRLRRLPALVIDTFAASILRRIGRRRGTGPAIRRWWGREGRSVGPGWGSGRRRVCRRRRD